MLGAALWAVTTSLPQPLMALLAFRFVDTFEPIQPAGLGFAAGAMLYVAWVELLSEAREDPTLTPNPDPDPDPNPDPKPNTNTDPGLTPDPDPNTDPDQAYEACGLLATGAASVIAGSTMWLCHEHLL